MLARPTASGALVKNQSAFRSGCCADPVEQDVAGNWVRIPLHKNLAASDADLPEWYCCRGTNRLETFHTQVRATTSSRKQHEQILTHSNS